MILICDPSVTVGGPNSGDRGKIQQNCHVVRGTVEDVVSFPPGFHLTDVEEYVELSDASLLFGMSSTEPQGVAEGNRGKQILREVDEKFISFSSIEQVELGDVADSATEPFRMRDEEE